MKRHTPSPTKHARASLLTKLVGLGSLLAASAPLPAHAEPDAYGIGDGHDGALSVSTANAVVNAYAQVTALAAGGGTNITVSSTTGFQIGQAILIWQTTGMTAAPASGAAGPFDLASEGAGRWEFSRIASIQGTTIGLAAPLTRSYPANVSQVVSVPEYTSVTINTGASIVAKPWDGKTGGIVALLANGTITNNGAIRADGRGFRGGAGSTGNGDMVCMGLDEPAPLGATRGEGLDVLRYASTGRGNVANGGGGGVCFASGGAGGGNGGAGGKGGRSNDGARPVGGTPGGALTYSPATQLLLGGGGGAGAGDGDAGGRGGSGGGVVFVRAASIGAAGLISAQGAPGENTWAAGAGGGGAGGTVYLRVTGSLTCSSSLVAASGGNGGNANAFQLGPGGGGGGGAALLQSASGTCTPGLQGASAGVQQDVGAPDGVTFGATGGAAGNVQSLPGAFPMPASPVLIVPLDGSSINKAKPVIAGTATPAADIVLFLDGFELGRTTADAAGNFALTPVTDIPEGLHRIGAATEIQFVRSKTSTVQVTFDRTPPDTVITSAPPALTNAAASTFTFSSEPNASFECSLDGAAFTACTSPSTLTVAEGPHTFAVRARDAAGNVDPSPAQHSWSVDRTAPEIDLTQKPNALTNATTATFAFTSKPGATFECRLDAAAFAPCTSPVTLAGLGEGDHTFAVRATDKAGNVSATPATYSWQVDLTAPVTTLGVTPANPTEATSATLTFSSEAGATFECQLDSAPTFTPCSSPVTFDGLALGSHTFRVRATDAAGNVESTPPSYTWSIVPPVVDAGVDASTPVDAGADAAPTHDAGTEPTPGDAGSEPSPDDHAGGGASADGGAISAEADGASASEGTSGCNVIAPRTSATDGLTFVGLGLAMLLRRRRR